MSQLIPIAQFISTSVFRYLYTQTVSFILSQWYYTGSGAPPGIPVLHLLFVTCVYAPLIFLFLAIVVRVVRWF